MSIPRFGLFSKSKPPAGNGSHTASLPEPHRVPPGSAAPRASAWIGDSEEVLISATLPRRPSNTSRVGNSRDASHTRAAALAVRTAQPVVEDGQLSDGERKVFDSSFAQPVSAPVTSGQAAKRSRISSPPTAGVQTARSPPREQSATPSNSTRRGSAEGRPGGAMGRPAVKQAHSDSDGESDDMTDTLELVLTSLRAGGGDGLQLDSLQSVYQHQRRAYLRHKKCAARAADEMHRAVKMIMLLAATPQPPPPPPESPSEPATRSCSVDHTAPSTAHAPAQSEHKQRRIRAPPRSTEGAAYRTGVLASKVAGNDSCGSPSLTPPPHLPATFQSDSKSCDTTVAGPPELQSSNKATRPFQFTTTLRNAFQLKPRAALACQFEGAAEPTAVAYGIDGTIQLWSPQTQKLIQVLHKDQLGMDFAEHLTQATPSLLAAVTGARSTAGSLENQGQLVFIGQKAQPGRLDAMSLGTAQHWPAMPHDGLVSVVEGMMGGRADRGPGRGMMVSGGVRDRKVLIWSLQTSGSRVVDAHVVHQMQTSHGSRVTALCYDPCHTRVLSGSESGKVNINDAETGQSVAGGSDDRVQGCVIGHIAMCPTSPHLAMVSCSQADNQLRIMDLRLRRSVAWPALTLGVATGRTQSRGDLGHQVLALRD